MPARVTTACGKPVAVNFLGARPPTWRNSNHACSPPCDPCFQRQGSARFCFCKATGETRLLQEWDTNYEVAWNWLWDNVATLLATGTAHKFKQNILGCCLYRWGCQVQTLGSSYKWEAVDMMPVGSWLSQQQPMAAAIAVYLAGGCEPVFWFRRRGRALLDLHHGLEAEMLVNP